MSEIIRNVELCLLHTVVLRFDIFQSLKEYLYKLLVSSGLGLELGLLVSSVT